MPLMNSGSSSSLMSSKSSSLLSTPRLSNQFFVPGVGLRTWILVDTAGLGGEASAGTTCAQSGLPFPRFVKRLRFGLDLVTNGTIGNSSMGNASTGALCERGRLGSLNLDRAGDFGIIVL